MPIYALDSNNNSTSLGVNDTVPDDHTVNETGDLHDQILALKSTTSGKYKDIQDLRLRILQILEGIRIVNDENQMGPEIIELRNAIRDEETQMRNLIKK